jgi:DNA-binding LacI/PurR family transcriptional regulator
MAGVSISTVSRALRNTPLVRAGTRSRVLRAAEELRYLPNWNACALAGAASRTVGVIVPNIENPFFLDIYKSVSRAMEAQGYDVSLKTTRYREQQLFEDVRQMIRERVAGLVVADCVSKRVAAELDDSLIPTIPCRVDYPRGVRQLVNHLRTLGHRKVGIMELPPSSPVDPRIAVLRSILASTPDLECKTAHAPDTFDGGRLACRALLAGDFTPTALIGVHDVMAVGALREAREQGYRVPDDLSLAGLDNIALAGFCAPALTTVHIGRGHITAALCRSLFGQADTDQEGCDCELIVRESTAAPRGVCK